MLLSTLTSQRFRRLSKEGVWIVLGQIAAVSGALVGVRLLTELLDPAAYGELALGMTVATLVNQTMLGPLGNGIARFYAPAAEQGDLRRYLVASRNLVLWATSIVGLIIILVISGLLIVGHAEWIAVTSIALIFAVLSGYSAILSGIQNAARQRSIVALHVGLESWMRFLIAAGLVVWLGATSTVTLIGYALALVLILGSQYVFFSKISPQNASKENIERNWREQIWAFSWPMSIFGIFTWVQLVSDRWALGLFSTTKEVGLYAVLFQLGYYPISIATGMAQQFFAPIFYQRAGDASNSQRNNNVNSLSWRITLLSLGLTMVSFLAAYLFHNILFQIFVAEEYREVSYLLPWVIFGGGVFAAGQAIALSLMSRMKTYVMMGPKIVTALLGIILNFAGAYWYGVAGIVFAGIIFSVLFFLWMMILFKYEEARNPKA